MASGGVPIFLSGEEANQLLICASSLPFQTPSASQLTCVMTRILSLYLNQSCGAWRDWKRNEMRDDIRKRALICAAVAVSLSLIAGCQTMQSFHASSVEKVSTARNWARDGFAAVKQGHLAKAKDCFSKAVRELPEDHRLTANLARTEFDQGNIDSAIATMETAVSNSGDPALHAEVGDMHLAAGHWLLANRHADLALEKDYRLSQAWILKGKLAAGKGDQQTALKHFHRASGLDSKNEEVQLLIAQTYLAMGRPMQSLSATETLLGQYTVANQPDAALLAKAEALVALKQSGPAISVLEMAAARPKCSKQIFFQLGQMQLQTGARQKAHATLLRGQQVHPNEPVFGQLLASLAPITTQPLHGGENPAGLESAPQRVAFGPAETRNR